MDVLLLIAANGQTDTFIAVYNNSVHISQQLILTIMTIIIAPKFMIHNDHAYSQLINSYLSYISRTYTEHQTVAIYTYTHISIYEYIKKKYIYIYIHLCICISESSIEQIVPDISMCTRVDKTKRNMIDMDKYATHMLAGLFTMNNTQMNEEFTIFGWINELLTLSSQLPSPCGKFNKKTWEYSNTKSQIFARATHNYHSIGTKTTQTVFCVVMANWECHHLTRCYH